MLITGYRPSIKLPIAETARLTHLAAHYTAGLISPGTTRVRAALVTTTPTPPGSRPLAPLQHPTPHRNRVTSHNRKEVTQCSHISEQHITIRGSAATHRKTATVERYSKPSVIEKKNKLRAASYACR
jgi:hypothetical protein